MARRRESKSGHVGSESFAFASLLGGMEQALERKDLLRRDCFAHGAFVGDAPGTGRIRSRTRDTHQSVAAEHHLNSMSRVLSPRWISVVSPEVSGSSHS